ncbi:MAG: ribose 5-phosphate isomerase [Bacteroidota bacterium]|jgi:ribose 5-phosphate isomerase B
MKIAIGADHAGVNYKSFLIEALTAQGFELINKGTDSEASCDYPDYAHPVADSVESGETTFGILICGSANGVAITANKHQGIRAALCWKEEIAALARQHNNANVVCIPARYLTTDEALTIALTFLKTDFEGGRHENRVNKIALAAC